MIETHIWKTPCVYLYKQSDNPFIMILWLCQIYNILYSLLIAPNASLVRLTLPSLCVGVCSVRLMRVSENSAQISSWQLLMGFFSFVYIFTYICFCYLWQEKNLHLYARIDGISSSENSQNVLFFSGIVSLIAGKQHSSTYIGKVSSNWMETSAKN